MTDDHAGRSRVDAGKSGRFDDRALALLGHMELNAASSISQRRLSLRRRVIGALVAVLVGALAVLFVLGVWNPWRFVVLEQYFGNPLAGVLAVAVGTYLALWLLLPVQNEAVQRGRLRIRVVVAVVAVLGLIGWGVFGRLFSGSYDEIARSDDGSRAVGLITPDSAERQYARIWEGTGLLKRDAGEIGRVCGTVTAHFVNADLVELDAGYGAWRIDLDPATGEPQQVLGPRCPDGPQPID
jgi:hypothetical protein